ncbi:nucleoside transporter Fun26p [[Candida] jaroonii]|uniref:Nucleoside transporter Fun26p n=1 Tax=[Candida] jaroonii TaxID=467808 RepID=A0ACA9YAH2_9ASCO|nr:nucleoside transporter Fun26p [[Candida] jaroonii]
MSAAGRVCSPESYRVNLTAFLFIDNFAVLNGNRSFELEDMTQHQSTESDIDHDSSTTVVNDPVVLRITSSIQITLSQLRYFTFTLVGIALLWPWNCFLSASAYYGERFANSTSLIKIYSSTMMSVSTLTSTIFNYYLSQVQKGVNYNLRLNFGLILTIIVFIIMAFSCVSFLFIKMNDLAFFIVLMFMVFISSLATCYAQNGTMATVNVLGGIYANAVMVGQAIAGVLPSVALIISILLVGDKIKTEDKKYVEKNYGVFVYYITASLVSITSMASLYLINTQKVQNQYRLIDEVMEGRLSTESQGPLVDEETPVQETHVPFGLLWKKLKLIVMTIFFTFGITLIFPVFASTVESVHFDSPHKFFKKDIYIPFIYLIWNLGDLLGRIFCGTPNSRLLVKDPKKLIIYSLSRLIFIPLFLTCNIHPYTSSGYSSALINSDLWYIFLQLVFGLTNGILSTSSFMVVRDFCDSDEEKEAAGGFTTVFLSIGLATGSLFSYLLVLLIN